MMGFFGAQLWTDGAWTEIDQTGDAFDAPDGPWLFISIHDSDIAAVQYAPAGPGTGQAFLGFTPRDYFDDPQASDPTDPVREALGLAAWAGRTTGTTPDSSTVQGFLASDEAGDVDLSEVELVEDLDEAEVFVEVKVAQFLGVLGLSVPSAFAS